jgi:hypothetical protein
MAAGKRTLTEGVQTGPRPGGGGPAADGGASLGPEALQRATRSNPHYHGRGRPGSPGGGAGPGGGGG